LPQTVAALIVTELKCSVTRDTQILVFDGCKNRLNSEEALSGIPDIENSEIDEHLVEIR
jgi:hypothetical protein